MLTVARLAPQKNLGLVLDVAAALADRDDLRFAVAGDGPERAALAGRIAAQHCRSPCSGTATTSARCWRPPTSRC